MSIVFLGDVLELLDVDCQIGERLIDLGLQRGDLGMLGDRKPWLLKHESAEKILSLL